LQGLGQGHSIPCFQLQFVVFALSLNDAQSARDPNEGKGKEGGAKLHASVLPNSSEALLSVQSHRVHPQDLEVAEQPVQRGETKSVKDAARTEHQKPVEEVPQHHQAQHSKPVAESMHKKDSKSAKQVARTEKSNAVEERTPFDEVPKHRQALDNVVQDLAQVATNAQNLARATHQKLGEYRQSVKRLYRPLNTLSEESLALRNKFTDAWKAGEEERLRTWKELDGKIPQRDERFAP